MGFPDRLKELRIHLFGKRGQKHFAHYIGIPQSSLGKYEKGVSPNLQALERILQRTGCSARWLLLGDGEMFESTAKSPPKNNANYKSVNHFGMLSSLGFTWPPQEKPRNFSIPAEYLNENYFTLILTGEAMFPDLREGDILIFEKIHIDINEDEFIPFTSKNLDLFFKLKFFSFHNKTVLITYDNSCEIRKLYVDVYRKMLTLMPANCDYPPTVFHFDDNGYFVRGSETLTTLEVKGLLSAIIRKVNID